MNEAKTNLPTGHGFTEARGSARQDVLLGNMPPKKLHEFYKQLLMGICEEDTAVRRMAAEVLTDFEVNGDSYGVPTVADIVETLVRRVKAPNAEVSGGGPLTTPETAVATRHPLH